MPNRFVIAPGHNTPALEQVVEEHDSYAVVEKRTEETEPRPDRN
jgi:hypothetical protein